jgi:hypothetical protein
MDDSTKPRTADIAVTGKRLHIDRNGVQAEQREDGQQVVVGMQYQDVFPLEVDGQTITVAKAKALFTAIFTKLLPLIVVFVLTGCGTREIGKSLVLADQALDRAVTAGEPVKTDLICAAREAIRPAIIATGKQDPGPVPNDDKQFIRFVYIQAGRAYEEAVFWSALRTALDPHTWEGILAMLGAGGGIAGVAALVIRSIMKNKLALKDAVAFAADAYAGSVKPDDHKARQKRNGTYDLLKRIREA